LFEFRRADGSAKETGHSWSSYGSTIAGSKWAAGDTVRCLICDAHPKHFPDLVDHYFSAHHAQNASLCNTLAKGEFLKLSLFI